VGNELDFGARVFDARIGRWLSVDPLQTKYASLTPYCFGSDDPIFYIDADGKVIRIHYIENGKNKYYTYRPGIKPTTNNAFVQQVHEAITAVTKYDKTQTFQNIAKSQEVVIINEINNGDDATHSSTNRAQTKVSNVNVDWDPLSALETSDKHGAQTPAAGLLHEAAHALRAINTNTHAKVLAFNIDSDPENAPNNFSYFNYEEQRVIDNVKTPYINAVNNSKPAAVFTTQPSLIVPQKEQIRRDHNGDPYPSKGVNSITPADPTKNVLGQQQDIDWGKAISPKQDKVRVVLPIH
jgi:hypothetical protein